MIGTRARAPAAARDDMASLVAALDRALSRPPVGVPHQDLLALDGLNLEQVLSRAGRAKAARVEHPRQALAVLSDALERTKARLSALPMPRELLLAMRLKPGARMSEIMGALSRTENCALLVAVAAQKQLTVDECVDKLRLLRTYNFVFRCRALGVTLNTAAEGRMTRLAAVARVGDAASAHTLLQCGADPLAVDGSNRTALDHVMADCDTVCRTACLGCVHQTTHELLRLATIVARSSRDAA